MIKILSIQMLAGWMLLCSVCVSCRNTPDYSLADTILVLNGYSILEAEGSLDSVHLEGLRYGNCTFVKYSNTMVTVHCSIGWKNIAFEIGIPHIPLSGKPDEITFDYICTYPWIRSYDADGTEEEYISENLVVRGWVRVDMQSLPASTVSSVDRVLCTCEINIITWLDGKELSITIMSIG